MGAEDIRSSAAVRRIVGSPMIGVPIPEILKKASEPIDVVRIVPRAQQGDPEASEELATHLRPKLIRFYYYRLPKSAGDKVEASLDLAQTTLADVFEDLPKFDGTLGKSGDYKTSFWSWHWQIARGNLYMEMRRLLAPINVTFMDNDRVRATGQPAGEPIDLSVRYRERLGQILTPEQMAVVVPRMDGLSPDEVAEQTGLGKRAVVNRFYQARLKMEEELIYPAGFKRVSEVSTGTALTVAAGRGALKGVKVLGIWYTTDDWLRQYGYKRQMVDPEMIDQGYLLLSQHVTPAEAGTLKGTRYREFITRHQGRIYISLDNLELFRAQHQLINKRYEAPGPGYEQLVTFAGTPAEYSTLKTAVRNEKLKAVKHGAWWFVKPEDYQEYIIARSVEEPTTKTLPGHSSLQGRSDPVVVFSAEDQEEQESKPPATFKEWFFSRAKQVSDKRLPWNKKSRKVSAEMDDPALFAELKDWMDKADIKLYPHVYPIIERRLTGASRANIATTLHYVEGSVGGATSMARKAIEEALIYPSGIKRVSDYEDKASMSVDAIMGRLNAVWFMGKWYTTDEMVEQYRTKKVQRK